MNLTTDFCIYRKSAKRIKECEVKRLVERIRSFATTMHNAAFWDSKGWKKNDHCVAVRACFGIMENAAYIETDHIELEVRKWVEELRDWCNDDADSDIDDEKYAHKKVRIEVKDLPNEGGLQIESFNKNEELEFGLFILPLKGADA